MSKQSIIALYKIQDSIPSYNELIEKYTIIPYQLTTKEKFINDMKMKPYSDAVAIYGSFPCLNPIGGLLDKQIISALPQNLKIIGISSAGYDAYDLDELAKNGIKLTNVPVSKEAAMDVADTALWHVISGCRKFTYWDKKTRDINDTLKVRDIVRNEDVNDKEVGFAFGHVVSGIPVRRISNRKAIVLGYGLIGQFLVERLKSLNMNVNIIVTNKEKYKTSKDYENIFNVTDLPEIAENTDVIVVCLPGGSNTKHIINENIINKLNPQSIIVNIGRGSCIDHQALKKAVEINHIGHVGLDVFDTEPHIEEFWTQNLKQCTLTPHLGSATFETFEFATDVNIKNIMSILEGKECENILN
ncbi:hypothetical protein CANINC_002881 [Pichia inconspicua]|uniref:D-isomer specific 2-hydroxyacid dehydrogenase NAD-binding domain-containing protein n=1 Tax=Pichia inconspicua TaxID=52247 RepID=A0A4T0X025_9ASCO|nr:hypothetical protein CANINC_002881 [[Candida] inconspicua]